MYITCTLHLHQFFLKLQLVKFCFVIQIYLHMFKSIINNFFNEQIIEIYNYSLMLYIICSKIIDSEKRLINVKVIRESYGKMSLHSRRRRRRRRSIDRGGLFLDESSLFATSSTTFYHQYRWTCVYVRSLPSCPPFSGHHRHMTMYAMVYMYAACYILVYSVGRVSEWVGLRCLNIRHI